MAEIKKVYKNWTEYDVLNSDTVGSALTAGTGIGISSNTISNTWVTSVNGQTWDVTVASGITKIFTLSSTSDLTNAQAAYDWYSSWNNPILKYSNNYYMPWTFNSTEANFVRMRTYGKASAWTDWLYASGLSFTLSSWSVTAITQNNNYIRLSSSAPWSWTTNSQITLVI